MHLDGNHTGAVLRQPTGGDDPVRNVTVSKSIFSGSTVNQGLHVVSKGNITVTNCDAENNKIYGARLENSAGSSTTTVRVAGHRDRKHFSGNEGVNTNGAGLAIWTRGAVQVRNIEACDNANSSRGLHIQSFNTDNRTPAVTLSNVIVSGNAKDVSAQANGMLIEVHGPINLTNVEVNNNGSDTQDFLLYGAYIHNFHSSGQPGITLTGVTFNGNQRSDNSNGSGLSAESKGPITVRNIEATGNSAHGAWLQNDKVGSTAAVSVTTSGRFTNSFHDNDRCSLQIFTKGQVTASNIEANNNDLTGVFIYNSTAASARSVTVSNVTASANGEDGLRVEAKGAVTLRNITANDNTTRRGVYVDSRRMVGADKLRFNIALNNVTANNNLGAQGTGILAYTHGSITAVNLQASGNAQYGADLRTSSDAANQGSIAFSGSNTFSNNRRGLLVRIGDIGTRNGYGNLNLTGITAVGNASNGIFARVFHEDNATNAGTVSVSRVTVNNNGSVGPTFEGLYIAARNNVTLNQVTALYNGGDFGGGSIHGHGVFIFQQGPIATVSVSNSFLHGNYASGLSVNINNDPSRVIISRTLYHGNDIMRTLSYRNISIH